MFHTQQHKVKRFVFLDFDGVVCTQRHRLEMVGMGQPWKDEFGPFFDPIAVENLKDIVDSTGANIIVTSTWKYKGLAAMQTLWNIRRMPGVLLDITPTLPAAFMFTRGMEINKWLYSNTPDNPEEFRYIIPNIKDLISRFFHSNAPLQVICACMLMKRHPDQSSLFYHFSYYCLYYHSPVTADSCKMKYLRLPKGCQDFFL